MTSSQDAGLFGPGSVTWRVHGDPILWVGGVRALFLQAVHPGAMAGVARHSGFRADPWGRLSRTADYVGTVTFGTRDEAERAAARVRGLHRRRRLDDPELLTWVHCCEVDSFLTAARRAGVPLARSDADRYVAEQVRAAELVGVPPGMAPASVAELRTRIASYRPVLRAGPDARDAALFILFPPMARRALPLRPVWAGLAGLAFCLLPPWVRRMYRLPGLPTTDVGAAVAVRALRTALLALPSTLREGPHRRTATRRLAAEPAQPAGPFERVTPAAVDRTGPGGQSGQGGGVSLNGQGRPGLP